MKRMDKESLTIPIYLNTKIVFDSKSQKMMENQKFSAQISTLIKGLQLAGKKILFVKQTVWKL